VAFHSHIRRQAAPASGPCAPLAAGSHAAAAHIAAPHAAAAHVATAHAAAGHGPAATAATAAAAAAVAPAAHVLLHTHALAADGLAVFSAECMLSTSLIQKLDLGWVGGGGVHPAVIEGRDLQPCTQPGLQKHMPKPCSAGTV
jgi:hypothetical protein